MSCFQGQLRCWSGNRFPHPGWNAFVPKSCHWGCPKGGKERVSLQRKSKRFSSFQPNTKDGDISISGRCSHARLAGVLASRKESGKGDDKKGKQQAQRQLGYTTPQAVLYLKPMFFLPNPSPFVPETPHVYEAAAALCLPLILGGH